MVVVGIDPGLTGGIGIVGSRNGLVRDIPTMPLSGAGLVKRKVDALALVRLLRDVCPPDESVMVCIESVRAMGGKNNAVQTQGSLMRTLGAIEAVVECLRWRVERVEPQTWKRWYGIGSDKHKSLEKARTLYPNCADISRAKDHNRAEALLLAHYGKAMLV